ncbi:hypothetical protein RhiirC2_858079 [Rhizophagus irregularis]|uniref:Uncharacterized protein n=1 Tax=Rhizophagus irregularis TaxID=588596 RepID=A0A2N1M840_9GLOM|nr:hypothetical protein RhiirC2_858079 [Rhizophagus irregularis]
MEVFSDSSWIRCIKKFKRNPSVKGFMVEKMCITSIYKNGFITNAKNFKPDKYKFFACVDEINFTLSEGLCTIYLPRYWNQKLIDVFLEIFWIMSINSINTLHNYSNTNVVNTL